MAELRAIEVDAAADEDEIRPEGAPALGAWNLALHGILSRIDTELFFQGTLSATLKFTCDRCLADASRDIRQEVEWLFEPGDRRDATAPETEVSVDDAEDVDGTPVRRYSGDTIDLAPSAWEELVFSLPSKRLCSDDCKGICPNCGKNLNDGACTCAEREAAGHPGLAGLKDMFPDLPETREE